MRTHAEINSYLALEFGAEPVERSVADDWPFRLYDAGHLRSGTRVLRFSADGERYWVLDGTVLSFVPVEDTDAADLEFEEAGRAWIASREPVDLSTSLLGDPNVPRTLERRHAIEELARAATGSGAVDVFEGLFLRVGGTYLALVATETALFVVGNCVPLISARRVSRRASRVLCVAVGEWLASTGGA